MDPLMTALVNLGIGTVMSAVILYLHLNAIKAFREDRQNDRAAIITGAQKIAEQHKADQEAIIKAAAVLADQQEKIWLRIFDMTVSNHDGIMAHLTDQGKALAALGARVADGLCKADK